MQDSMYITDNILLRTHTSGMQARTLQAHKPNEPFKIIAPGKVYRCDYDATHSPVFHQMEGMIIDKDIRFSDLKGMLEDFLRDIFGAQTKVRYFLCHVRRQRLPGLLPHGLAGNPRLRHGQPQRPAHERL